MTFPPGAVLNTQSFGSRPEGVEVPTFQTRNPAITDVQWPLGKEWINTLLNDVYVLTSFSALGGMVTANWTATAGGSSILNALTGDSGGQVPPTAGNIDILGSAGITSVGDPGASSITYELENNSVDGELLIGSSVAPLVRAATLTAGAGIAIANGHGTITITATGAGFAWMPVTSASNPVTLAASTGYIANGGGQVVFQLPSVATVGQTFVIAGVGNAWVLNVGAGQVVTLGALSSTVSVTAALASDTIELLCVVANTTFKIIDVQGNPIFA